MSIATRVSVACAAVLLLSLLLLGSGLAVGNGIRDSNEGIVILARALQVQDRNDQSQRAIRLDLGEATRMAEKGVPVSPSRWKALSRALDEFEAASAADPSASPQFPFSGVTAASVRTRTASARFVAASRSLVAAARQDGSAVKSAMPMFLASLRQLETERSRSREALVAEIGGSAERNRTEAYRRIIWVLTGGFFAAAIIFAMTVWLRDRLLWPIVSIAARLREFNSGDAGGAIPGLHRQDELGELARGLAEYRAAVEKRAVAERRADFLAHHDVLTGLANRLLFDNRLAHELARSRRTGDQIAIFAIDLDGFKGINDRHGHAGGDQALKRVASMLSGCVRGDDLVARLGGDEFAIIQAAPDQPAAAAALMKRLFAASAATAQEDIEIRISVGVAISGDAQDGEELHNLADLALYQAKSEGRNTGRFFDAGLKERERLRMHLARDLEHAVAAGQLRVVFQPIADIGTLQPVGYEALLRWRHPDFGEVPPDQFIPIAEKTGLIESIGLWVADEAFAAAAAWDPAISLSLNLSPVQFRKAGTAADLIACARKHELAVDRLEFEVTESATLLGSHRDEVLRGLALLQASGARIVMDDFGTGHSSLSNLKEFPFDKLKIDRSFVAAMRDDKSSASIVKATIGLGKSLGVTIVAEGVETELQLRDLRRWGCHQVQGYLIGRPSRAILDVVPPATAEHAGASGQLAG
ncbi:bifunctional diguanylate cyclase/phosphodiesterase [Sphingosinicella sp. BN140058]|uniref:putative bifunctional diguanylate cyclase/phosphodiesterase n=1 Tax=Sphingosinicella sp. BN140058 TaxID=1892855 RepID=UPI0010127F8A|nr:EAL domain-containing protein [Sphingosinicella sp. BN140058]QAY77876.1 EAL domain-containing protein [Sphingosinicella sp. BN140058]